MRIRTKNLKKETSGVIKKLFVSHSDLDGAGCLAIARHFNDKLKFTAMISRDYDFELDEEDFEYMKTFNEIIIADLSIKEEKTKELRELGIIVRFFDHHESAVWLKDEKDSSYNLDYCGTYLFWNDYVKKFISRYPLIIDEFVSLVNVYDLWKQEDELWERAKNLNSVLYGVKNYSAGSNYYKMLPFFELFEQKISHLTEWTETRKEKLLVAKSNKREQDMYEKAVKNMTIREDKKGKLFGTFALVSKISVVCSRILQEQENLDYIVCFNTWGGLTGKLSFRSQEGFNCNDLGSAHGHDCAAGGRISPDMAIKVMENMDYVFTYNEDYDENDINTSIEKV